jgi:hypothetical protein
VNLDTHNERAYAMAQFTRRTILAATDLVANWGHTEINRLLLEYDTEIAYVRESIKTRQESVKLVAARVEGGVSSALDLDQSKTLVYSAQADLAQLEKAQEQTENLISFLLGRHPGPIARGRKLTDQPQPPQVPAGLPSSLLERRPDLRSAEQQLVAANARVGVAKAAFYPSINLTAAGGYQTSELLGIASRSAFGYSMLGLLDLLIAGLVIGLFQEFLLASIFLKDVDSQTLAVGLYALPTGIFLLFVALFLAQANWEALQSVGGWSRRR